MKPREIDQFIAKDILGRTVVRQKNGSMVESADVGVRPLAAYSTQITAAWELVERFGITLVPVENNQWFALLGTGQRWRSPAEFIQYLQKGEFSEAGAAVAETAAMSVCLALVNAHQKQKLDQHHHVNTGPSDSSKLN